MRLEQYFETEQAQNNTQLRVKYVGSRPSLQGRGEAYFNVQDDRWYFRKDSKSDWIRVHEESIEFMS